MISACSRLEPVIDSNDKTLLTDGHIDVHSSEVHSKETFEGRVVVQVKGRKPTGARELPHTFPISKTDLAGYLKNNGVLFFVVFVNPKTNTRHPAYALLNPFKIQYLIDKMEGRKQIAVDIKRLPSDPSKIEAIVKLALQTRNEQPGMRVDIKQLGDLSSITVYSDGSLNFDAPVVLKRATHDFTLVAENAKGMTVFVDMEFSLTPNEYVGEEANLTFSSGDFVFRNPVKRRVDQETFELVLSDGLKIQLSIMGQTASGSMMLTMRETLRERFNDLGFYFASVDNQFFHVDGEENKFDVAPGEDQQDLRRHFKYLTTLVSLCDALGINSSLVELEPLEGVRGRQLISLHGVMVEGKEIDDPHRETGRIFQPVGRWGIQLIVVRDSAKDRWQCRDLFDPELGQQFILTGETESGENQIRRVTPYEIVDREQLPYTLNLHLDNVVNAYDEIFEYPETSEYANLTVLNLIHAADIVEVRKTEFLDAALTLNNWLILKQGDRPNHQINDWQIAARKGKLAQDQRSAIRSLKREISSSEDEYAPFIEAGCAILLGEEEDVAYYLSLLDAAQLTRMQEWPIWDLYMAAKTVKDA